MYCYKYMTTAYISLLEETNPHHPHNNDNLVSPHIWLDSTAFLTHVPFSTMTLVQKSNISVALDNNLYRVTHIGDLTFDSSSSPLALSAVVCSSIDETLLSITCVTGSEKILIFSHNNSFPLYSEEICLRQKLLRLPSRIRIYLFFFPDRISFLMQDLT